ncbi:glycoside hydrolase family 10 protein [uncultured Duncaniella sp.]|uniref:glycoside hydrolase family 10 protein n=1 Tax=uncultured Duncaniella sp. TaxID=2768039 RepID=UPI0026F3F88D|nr:family 10 glycosylhydrolase [uncultured Duncaniella sp.]
MKSIAPLFSLKNILLSLLFMSMAASVAASPKREMRGVWIATVWGIDWPSKQGVTENIRRQQQQQLSDILDRCKQMNLTTVCFQVRGMADVMFRSELEPWSSFVSGKRGTDPGWDPLEWVTAECHRRGLECYAWVNPFRWSSGTDYNSPQDKKWKDNGWLLSHGKYTVFNPGLEEARQHIVDICREIVEGYDIDGLIFDDYFYPNRIPETSDAPDYHLYRNESPWMTFGDWRRANIHKAIADVKSMISDTKPYVRFGISPAGVAGKDETSAAKWGAECVNVKASDWQYKEIYSDPLGMMYQGTVDFVSPQIYWPTTHDTAPYIPLAKWWYSTANMYGSHLYTSVTLERINTGSLAEHRRDLERQIDCNRRSNIDGNQGIMIYSAKFLPKVSHTLSGELFAYPSLTPAIKSAEETTEPPRNLKLRHGSLSWHPINGVRRYTVYAVPDEVSILEAMDENGDGIDGAFLIGVTYEPRYEVGTEKGYRYAVCAYSGFSTEGTPAWLD